MHEKTPQEYAQELMQMYSQAQNTQMPERTERMTANSDISSWAARQLDDTSGGLQVNVTTLRGLFPVSGAELVVFTGAPQSKTVIERGTSDISGQSGIFKLKTPPKSLSDSAEPAASPYATYNLSVAADGFVERIFMDIPVFSGVVSVQGADLTPISAVGKNTAPDVTNGENSYDL